MELWGIRVNNPANELVVDSNLPGLHYYGKATLMGALPRGPRERQYCRYAITLPNASCTPMVFFVPTASRAASIERITRSSPGSSQWLIDLFIVDTTIGDGSLTFGNTPSLDVHVFTQTPTNGSAYGISLLNSSRTTTWDFSAKPLYIRQAALFTAKSDIATYGVGDSCALAGGISQPAVFYKALGYYDYAFGATGGHKDDLYLLTVDSAGNFLRRRFLDYYENGEVGGTPFKPSPQWNLPANEVLAIDLSIY